MDELRERLNLVDRLEPPSMWDEARARSEVGPTAPTPRGPSGGRRFAIAGLALAVGAAGITFAVAALRSRGTPPVTAASSVSSSVALGHGLVCSVSAPATVHPGAPIGVRFTFENLGAQPARVSPYPGATTFVVQSADGTLYDTSRPLSLIIGMPPRQPIVLKPGGSLQGTPSSLLVRWGGPLTITPRCEGKLVPPLTLAVANPGHTPTAQSALDRAATAAQIFGNCMPQANGTSVVGEIAPPDGAPFNPFDARCWAEVRPYPGFVTVTFAFVSPSSTPAVPLTQYWFDLHLPKAPLSEVSQWTFVVTASSVYSVDGPAGAANTPPKLVDVDYRYGGGTWTHQNPGRTCGGAGTDGPGLYFFKRAFQPCG